MDTSARAMVFGSFVADSLSLGAHWVYDTGKIDTTFGRVSELLPAAEGGYHSGKGKGELTHYGDQALHLLNHLSRHQGVFQVHSYAKAWQDFMADYRGYLDRASKYSLSHLQASGKVEESGSPSTDLGGAARIAPLLYAYRGNQQALGEAVRAQTALTHNSSPALAGARFLAESCLAILAGSSPREAFQQALAQGIDDQDLALRIGTALSREGGAIRQRVAEFGQACGIGAALPGAVYTVVSSSDSFEEALIETVMAGGDSAARGMVVGMVLGAHLGMGAIPQRWLDDLVARQEIATALDALP